MKKDYKLKIPYDYRRPFGDYGEHEKLAHYFKFYSADDDSINPELENLALPGGRKAEGNNVTPLRNTPYNKLVKYSSALVANPTSTSYYRIPWGGTNYGAYRNNGRQATIAMWISLENMRVGWPRETNALFNKVFAGSASGAWTANGEMRLEYRTVGAYENRLVWYWQGEQSLTPYDVEFKFPNFDELLRGPYRNGDWFHFAMVIEKSLNTWYGDKDIRDVVSFYINGLKVTFPSADVNGGDGTNPWEITGKWHANQAKGDILIARGKGDQDTVSDYSQNSSMNIYDLGIWSTPLSSAALDSIYQTSQYFEGSGFLSLPPRVQLKREISTTPAYLNSLNTPVVPSVDRPYDDTRQVQYSSRDSEGNEQLRMLQYPLGIPAELDVWGNWKLISGSLGLVSSSLASPNILPDIIASGNLNFNILKDYYLQDEIAPGEPTLTPFNDALVLPNHSSDFYGATESIVGFRSKLRDKIQLTIELPVNEISTVTRHSAKWDDAASFDPLPGGEGNTPTLNPHYDDEGEFQDEDLTGFLYYNKIRGVWEQKGLHYLDSLSPAAQVNNGLIPIDEIAQETKCQNLTIGQETVNPGHVREILGQPMMNSGSSNSMRLFYPGGITAGQGQYYAGGEGADGTTINDEDRQLAANVGHPMASNYGPNAIQYYATSSQLLSMKDYISQPFMLEKVILELPDTTARKIFDFGDNSNSPTCGRPQDDYVFFLMRQARNFPGLNSDPRGVGGRLIDNYLDITGSLNDASSSIRYIICSGVAAFYNSERRVPGKSPATIPSWSPLNSPSFSFNFGATVNNAGQNTMSRTGPITLNMSPAVASRKILGNYILPTWDGSNNLYLTQSISDQYLYTSGGLFPATIQAFWPGGTSTMPLSGAATGSRSDTHHADLHLAVAPQGIYGVPYTATNPDQYNWSKDATNISYNQRTFFEVNPYRTPLEQSFSGKIIDSRTFKFFGAGASSVTIPDLSIAGLSGSWLAGQPDKFSVLNAPSPYVLFPEDNLILGLDAALGWTATMAAGITPNALDANGTLADQALVCGANNLTGSYLRINSGQPMTLRLFGSLIKDHQQAPRYPLSNITQPDITQPIVGAHVVDQWDISSVRENSGSYRERLFTGSMTFGLGPNRTPNVSFVNQSAASWSPGFEWTATSTQNAVVTCSFGTGYDMWGQDSGGTANPFYIRVVPTNALSTPDSWANLMDTRITGGGGGNLIRPDEIYVMGSIFSATVLQSILSYGLKNMVNGDPNGYYARFGADCGGSVADDNKSPYGIPGLNAAVGSGYWSVSITATTLGAGGNTVMFSGGVAALANTAVGASPYGGSWQTGNTNTTSTLVVPGVTQVLRGGYSDNKPFRQLAATAGDGNLGEFGAFNRFVTIPCGNEKYYDSAVPRLEDIWANLGRQPIEIDIGDLGYPSSIDPSTSTSFKVLVFGISVGDYLISEPGATPDGILPIGDPFASDWWGAFPFEPRFNFKESSSLPLTRTERMFGSQATVDAAGRVAGALYWLTDDAFPGWGNGYPGNLSGSFGFCWQDLIGGPNATMGDRGAQYSNAEIGLALTMENQRYGESPTLFELAESSLKLFYGVGDGVGNLIESSPEDYLYPTSDEYIGDGTHIDANGIYPSIYRIFRRANKPRGWKYGLINALPQNTQCVFRSDHYGQFRDLLEGRPYTMFSQAGASSATNGGETTRHIKVRFVKPLWIQENPWERFDEIPEETRSGNMSQYATSSLPFFDEVGAYAKYPHGRDRPDNIPTAPPSGWVAPEIAP